MVRLRKSTIVAFDPMIKSGMKSASGRLYDVNNFEHKGDWKGGAISLLTITAGNTLIVHEMTPSCYCW